MQRRLSPGTEMTSTSTLKRCDTSCTQRKEGTDARKALPRSSVGSTPTTNPSARPKGKDRTVRAVAAFIKLAGDVGNDWGVCSNPARGESGLLTFEHQGCAAFEAMTGGDGL